MLNPSLLVSVIGLCALTWIGCNRGAPSAASSPDGDSARDGSSSGDGGTRCKGDSECPAGRFCSYFGNCVVDNRGMPCSDSSACGTDQLCSFDGHCGSGGSCIRLGPCSAIALPVCGCDGKDYLNGCVAHGFPWVPTPGTSAAYGGPCRSGTITACGPGSSCPNGQVCIDDPRAQCAPGASCPGICVHDANALHCGGTPSIACGAGPSGDFQVCVNDQLDECPPSTPGCLGRCVFITGVTCDANSPCPQGQLCVPSIGCASGACPHYCTVP
jgi:hypothetical protein